MKEAGEVIAGFSVSNAKLYLERLDVLRTRSFRAVTGRVRNSLSLMKLFVPNSLEVRHVEKHVAFGSGVDETESLVCQPLNRTFCHQSYS